MKLKDTVSILQYVLKALFLTISCSQEETSYSRGAFSQPFPTIVLRDMQGLLTYSYQFRNLQIINRGTLSNAIIVFLFNMHTHIKQIRLLHACKVVARLLQGCNKLVTMSRPIARL